METTWKGRKSLYDTTATTSQSDSVTIFKCNFSNYGVTSEEVSSFNFDYPSYECIQLHH